MIGKNKFALKRISGKINCIYNIYFFFFLMEDWVIEDPASQPNGKFHFNFLFFGDETLTFS